MRRFSAIRSISGKIVQNHPSAISHPVTQAIIINMNRSDLIARLAELQPQLLAKDAEMAVKVILESMSSTLSRGGHVEIRGFGSFCLNYRPPRRARNPKTGDGVKIPAKYVPHFKVGKELRERVSPVR